MKSNDEVVQACVTEAKHLLETKIPFKDAIDGAIELHKPMTKSDQDKLRNLVVDALNQEKFSGIIERSRSRTNATRIVRDDQGRTTMIGRVSPQHSRRDLAAGAGVEDRLEEIQRDRGNPGAA